MKLQKYLETKGLSFAEFARRIKTSANAVGHYVAGRRKPKPEIMARITKETGGKVKPNDFYEVTK